MPTPREFPYIWATWLPRLLVGDRSCEWAVWFKAHYQDFERQPSDFRRYRLADPPHGPSERTDGSCGCDAATRYPLSNRTRSGCAEKRPSWPDAPTS